MGSYSATLSKRLRKRIVKNDRFWDCDPNLNLRQFIFEERFPRKEWQRIQATHGIKTTEADAHYDLYLKMEHWMNDEYWAVLDKECRRALYKTFQGIPLWHLELSRRDEQPLRDWQILQAIKNHVVGKEYEAVELYPAHSRLMDVRNKYHLWILVAKNEKEPPPRFALGCDRFGAIRLKPPCIVVAERVIQAMSDEEQEQLRKNYNHMHIRLFPEALRGEVEKEFPGMESCNAILQYVKKHPELSLEAWDKCPSKKGINDGVYCIVY